ncbi:MAG: Lsr2 family protein [Propionibacteriaceae bacterium]|nr:Lsr2 family protein [Propionibacteriaceae bacterium]
MALKITKVLVDDIDGSTATGTVSFTFNGVSYEIDLNDTHQGELAAALEPYTTRARRVGGKRVGRKVAPSVPTTAIRAWAAENGYKVADRGRIPAEVVEAYQKAMA